MPTQGNGATPTCASAIEGSMQRGEYVWWKDRDGKSRTGQYVRTVERGKDFGKMVIFASAIDRTVKVMPECVEKMERREVC